VSPGIPKANRAETAGLKAEPVPASASGEAGEVAPEKNNAAPAAQKAAETAEQPHATPAVVGEVAVDRVNALQALKIVKDVETVALKPGPATTRVVGAGGEVAVAKDRALPERLGTPIRWDAHHASKRHVPANASGQGRVR